MTRSFCRSYREHRSLSGLKIGLERTHRENWIRYKAGLLQHWFATRLYDDDHISDDTIAKTVAIFRSEAKKPIHYGDNSPQLFAEPHRIPLYPNPTFNYWDFFGYALSGYEDHFRGFARELQLDDSITYEAAAGIIGLLLVDSAISHLEQRDPYRACADIFDATQAFDEMIAPGSSLQKALLRGPEASKKVRLERKSTNETRWRKTAKDIWQQAILSGEQPPTVRATAENIYDEEARNRQLQRKGLTRDVGTIHNAIKALRQKTINKAKAEKRRNQI